MNVIATNHQLDSLGSRFKRRLGPVSRTPKRTAASD